MERSRAESWPGGWASLLEGQPCDEARSHLTTGRILLVDDEHGVRHAWTRVLQAAGFDVRSVCDGVEAVELIGRESFDAIVSDVAMPRLNGIDLLRELRQRGDDTPVVLVTGAPALETAIEAIDLNVYRFLVKPVGNQDLVASVHGAVRWKRVAEMMSSAFQRARHDQTEVDPEDRSAFARVLDGLWIAYQPIVHPDNSVFGYEALMRSVEPRLPNPVAVIQAAEVLGQVQQLGRVVRSRAIAPFAESGCVLVNLLTEELSDETLAQLEAPLTRVASRVVLEITERASIHDLAALRDRIAELRRLGFRIAIDDLGAGYAGLASLGVLEPELVKIDMALVRGVDSSPMKRKLIRAVSSVCREMGILVVAEGVETPSERDVLVELGCDLLQGYLLGKPQRELRK